MKLTDTVVRSLPLPDSGNRITYDDAVPGFGMRVTAAGARSFVLNYRIEGRERRITIGPYPAWSVAAAREQAQKLRRKIDTGDDPLGERQRRRDADSIGELCDRYIQEHAKPKKRSWQEDQRRIDKYVLPAWKSRKIEDIHRREVAELIGKIARTAPIEANRVLALVRKTFSFALDAGLIQNHPCLRMAAPAKENARHRALQTAGEFKAFWEATSGGEWAEMVPAREAAALRLLLLTAARPSEVAELPWSEVLEDEWHLPAVRNKGKRDHLIPLVSEAVKILKARKGHGDKAKDGMAVSARYVFQGERGGPLSKKHIEQALSAACKRFAEQGIERFTPHDLRRTAETGMASIGVSKEIRDRVLNHKDSSVGAVNYNRHDYKSEKRAALEAWANHVLRQVRGMNTNVAPIGRAKKSRKG